MGLWFWRAPQPPTIEETDGHVRIFGYQQYLRGKGSKRALLSYLPAHVQAGLRGEPTTRFSNEGIAREWPRVLNELGYTVDIVGWDDADFTPSEHYDLVILHGAKAFTNLYQALNPKPPLIHFLTGTYWRFNNAEEEKRLQDFARRHGVSVPRDRYIAANEDPVNDAAKGIITLGDERVSQTFNKYTRVIAINNASYPDGHFANTPKDYASARKHFLFFAGAGNVHKGLDLTIEAFQGLDAHLHVVTVLDKPVIDALAKEVAQPNIHLIGEVPMRTPQFYEEIDQCGYVIMPSCSEGQPGSVVEAMHQGLVPVVSQASGLDAEGYGTVLPIVTAAEIRKAVERLAAVEPAELVRQARHVREVAMRDHTPEHFRKSLKQAITAILS